MLVDSSHLASSTYRHIEDNYGRYLKEHVASGIDIAKSLSEVVLDTIIDTAKNGPLKKELLMLRIDIYAGRIGYLETESDETAGLMTGLRERLDRGCQYENKKARWEAVIGDLTKDMQDIRKDQDQLEDKLRSDTDCLQQIKYSNPDTKIDVYISRGVGLLRILSKSRKKIENAIKKAWKVGEIYVDDKKYI